VDFSIKNIGIGPALDINIFNSKGVKAVLADFSQGVFQEYSSLGHLEVGASNSWVFCLDKKMASNDKTYTEEWNLEYADIFGNKIKSDIHMFINIKTNKAGISIKT